MIIVDTSFLISLFYYGDSNHEIAKIDYLEHSSTGDILAISDLVLQEFITVMKIKLKSSSERIELFANDLLTQNLYNYEFHFLKLKNFAEIVKLSFLNEFRNLSFIDISVLYLTTIMKSSTILTYDKDLLKAIDNTQ